MVRNAGCGHRLCCCFFLRGIRETPKQSPLVTDWHVKGVIAMNIANASTDCTLESKAHYYSTTKGVFSQNPASVQVCRRSGLTCCKQ